MWRLKAVDEWMFRALTADRWRDRLAERPTNALVGFYTLMTLLFIFSTVGNPRWSDVLFIAFWVLFTFYQWRLRWRLRQTHSL